MRDLNDERRAKRIIYDQISNLKGALHWETYEDLIYIRAKLDEALWLMGIHEEICNGSEEQHQVAVALESA